MLLSVSVSTICSLFISFRIICALIPWWGFLIVRAINFLQAFEEISRFAAYKLPCIVINIIGAEFQNFPARFTSLAIISSTCQIGRHKIKNRGSIDPLHCRSFIQSMFREIRS